MKLRKVMSGCWVSPKPSQLAKDSQTLSCRPHLWRCTECHPTALFEMWLQRDAARVKALSKAATVSRRASSRGADFSNSVILELSQT
ncbi:unnamed protein product [Cuscuta campestris]|uniref:Uncharacterized protein n=1 Tax=Cuscuta campestris TaxID=132261 RepID=A0A484LFE5_9ASTE|nr:unnamed protein product [Cuscuta campestris]